MKYLLLVYHDEAMFDNMPEVTRIRGQLEFRENGSRDFGLYNLNNTIPSNVCWGDWLCIHFSTLCPTSASPAALYV